MIAYRLGFDLPVLHRQKRFNVTVDTRKLHHLLNILTILYIQSQEKIPTHE